LLIFGAGSVFIGLGEVDDPDLLLWRVVSLLFLPVFVWFIIEGHRFSVYVSDHGLIVRYAIRRPRPIHWKDIVGLSFNHAWHAVDIRLVSGDAVHISLLLDGAGQLLHRLHAHTPPTVHGSFFADVERYWPLAFQSMKVPSAPQKVALLLLSAVVLLVNLGPLISRGFPRKRALSIDAVLRDISPPRPHANASAPPARIAPWTAEEVLWVRELALVGAYDSLDRVLGRLSAQAAAHVQAEERYYDAQASFWDPQTKPALDDWLVQRPASLEGRLARASQFVFLAFERRGSRYLHETSRAQISAMNATLDSALVDARTALMADPNALAGYWVLLRAAKGPRATEKVLPIALVISPASLVTRTRAMMNLLPRWGGSYEAMERLAYDAQSYARQNPALRTLRGFVAWDQANLARLERDYATAERYVNASLVFGESYYPCLEGAKVFLYSDRGELGLRYAECAVRLRPSFAEAQLRFGQTMYDNAHLRYFNRDYPLARAAAYLAFQLDPEDPEIVEFWEFVAKQGKDMTSR
jgi:hypothetical protein